MDHQSGDSTPQFPRADSALGLSLGSQWDRQQQQQQQQLDRLMSRSSRSIPEHAEEDGGRSVLGSQAGTPTGFESGYPTPPAYRDPLSTLAGRTTPFNPVWASSPSSNSRNGVDRSSAWSNDQPSTPPLSQPQHRQQFEPDSQEREQSHPGSLHRSHSLSQYDRSSSSATSPEVCRSPRHSPSLPAISLRLLTEPAPFSSCFPDLPSVQDCADSLKPGAAARDWQDLAGR